MIAPEISILKVEDCAEVREVFKECLAICEEIGSFQGFFSSVGKASGDYIVIAKSDGNIVGAMTVESFERTLFIICTIVKPDMQRRGISRAMLRHLEEHGKGHDSVCSSILCSNPASVESRKKMGFDMREIGGSFIEAKKRINPAVATKEILESGR